MKNILIYIHDEMAYGHFSRIKKIASKLSVSHNVSIIIGGISQIDLPDNIHVIYLPYLFLREDKNINLSTQEKLEERKVILQKLCTKNSYDVLLIDYFPFGRHFLVTELHFLISYLKEGKGIKVYSIMRDIFTGIPHSPEKLYSEYEERRKEFFSQKDVYTAFEENISKFKNCIPDDKSGHFFSNFLLKYYLGNGLIDNILAFGDENIYRLESEFFLDENVGKKFLYQGYILPKKNQTCTTKDDYILVSLGGNIFNKEKFLRLLHVCKKLEHIKFKVILGKMMSDNFRNSIKKHFLDSNIELIDFSKNFGSLLQGSKVFIGGGGYGTVTDILCYGVKSLLFQNYDSSIPINKTEQFKRIDILSKKNSNISFVQAINDTFVKELLRLYYSDSKNHHNFGSILNTKGDINIDIFIKNI